MPKASPPTSLAQMVYSETRRDILAGRHLPGERLNIRTIAEASRVSLSVVREALTRLAEQGLVVAAPQLGFSVVPLDVEDLRDLTRVRILIEGTALKESVACGSAEYEARVLAAHHLLSRQPVLESGVTEEWAHAHAEYHAALCSGSTSVRLRAMVESLRDASELYRRWSGQFEGNRNRDVAAEHHSLMEATLAGDSERALELLTEHINTTARLLFEHAVVLDRIEEPSEGEGVALA